MMGGRNNGNHGAAGYNADGSITDTGNTGLNNNNNTGGGNANLDGSASNLSLLINDMGSVLRMTQMPNGISCSDDSSSDESNWYLQDDSNSMCDSNTMYFCILKVIHQFQLSNYHIVYYDA
jgi:hypothetical protein